LVRGHERAWPGHAPLAGTHQPDAVDDEKHAAGQFREGERLAELNRPGFDGG
jgi:hypothetical protein